MWCMECFTTPHHPHCPQAPEPPIAFDCDRCGQAVYMDELEDAHCYQTPDGRIICGECIYMMSTHQLLIYLGCVTRTTPL